MSVSPAAGITVEAFVERIHAQLRTLSQDSPDAGHTDHPWGAPRARRISPMSGRHTGMLPLFLTAMLGLTPQLAQAFAFNTGIEPSSVVPNQTTGNPIVWALPQVTIRSTWAACPLGRPWPMAPPVGTPTPQRC